MVVDLMASWLINIALSVHSWLSYNNIIFVKKTAFSKEATVYFIRQILFIQVINETETNPHSIN